MMEALCVVVLKKTKKQRKKNNETQRKSKFVLCTGLTAEFAQMGPNGSYETNKEKKSIQCFNTWNMPWCLRSWGLEP